LINTLSESEQGCIIPNTINPVQEEKMINTFLERRMKQLRIIIYGKNANDDTIFEKYNQLIKLGFQDVYIYPGGLFEWLLLQDIYGLQEFPTTSKQTDILKYKPRQLLNIGLIKY
jgi:Rhodanese-like domain